jgi:bifunctional UDP-N-acetylglucosamine pyrophosphorylase/glucosamine-1-phosphate N-acetyltransferase
MLQGPIAIILAAGHGKRMKSDQAKVLHEVCGRPMIHYVVEAAREAGCRSILVIVGYGAHQVRAALHHEPDVHFATQTEQKGTGNAVKACRPLLEGYTGPALILVGDEPLLRPEPLGDLLRRQAQENAACLMGTAKVENPTGFGRILRDTAGHFLRIIEQRDCRPEEAAIREVNPSCYVFQLPLLWDALDTLNTNNAQGEEYLTDAPTILQQAGHKVMALEVLESDDILGVNARQHLAEAQAIMQSRIHNRLMSEGVTIVDPRNTYIDGRVEIGADTVIYPFTVLQGRVRIGRNCRVGPFAHLRDGSTLADDVEVGAYVELSRTQMETGSRARHLAYLGDAQIDENVNIGAGAVIANFDGVRKHHTRIGTGASVGSGSVLIAPVTIGDRAVIGAGTVVPKGKHVAPGRTVIGVPARPLVENGHPVTPATETAD